MIAVTVSQWNNMNLECRQLYSAYLEARPYNLYQAVNIMRAYKKLLNEEFLLKNSNIDVNLLYYQQFIEAVANARMEACQNMQRLIFFHKGPIEFFDECNLETYSPVAAEIVEQYQYKKKLAYAILHR